MPQHRAPGFRVFGTTADIGVRARGNTRARLFENAARGMFSLIGSPRSGARVRRRRVSVRSTSAELLLHCWLSELLFLFDAKGMFGIGFEGTAVTGDRLQSVLLWVDASSARLRRQIKAVTLHGMKIERISGIYSASVIFDI